MTRNYITFTAVLACTAAACLPASAQSTQSPASFELLTSLSTQTSAGSDELGNTVVGDFNGDGKPDLISSASAGYADSPATLVFSAGNGDGTFQTPVTLSGTANQSPLVAVDFNNDGILDLLTIAEATSGSLINGELVVYYGKGDGTFDGPFGIPGSTGGAALYQNVVAVGDLNGDGLPDIAVGTGNSSGTQGAIFTYLNQGNGVFTQGTTIPIADVQTVYSLQIADVDQDGHPDLVFGTSGSSASTTTVSIAWGEGRDQFTAPAVQRSYSTAGTVTTTVSDVNQDGAPDVLANFCGEPTSPDKGGYGSQSCAAVDVFYGGQGPHKTFYRNALSNVNLGPLFNPIAVDVNGDGIADIVSGGGYNKEQEGLFVWYGNPDGSFNQTAQNFIVTSGYTSGPIAADFNRDGKMDFFLPIIGTEYLNATPPAPCATSQISPTVVVCSPVNQAYVPATAISVQADAYDKNPVTALQLYADGNLVESERTTAFNVPLGLATGNHLLVTKAWDSKGISFRSNRTITVYNGTPGSVCTAPEPSGAAICLPNDNTGGTTHIIGNGATPNVPDSVQLYVDGSLAVNNNTGGSTAIDTRLALSSGTHTLVFKLWDANGHVYTAQKSVTVSQ